MGNGMDELLSHTVRKKKSTQTKRTFLTSILNEYLWNMNFQDLEEDKERHAIRGFHPSSLYDVSCPTVLILDYFGHEEVEGEWEIDAKLRRIFDNGSDFHQ